ncbi:hypothetical protein ACFYKX_19910 [Cytobacillus sp. FJAT-54145]|uniref:Uncharacterized protein n=1 Tax=Cytobacillus spartinae TaxID=3299023 RepID=A0ABW6KI11_9BACI
MTFPNYLWYIILLSISVTVFVITLKENRNWKRLLQTLFFISGLSYVVDFIVLVLLNGYTYKPNLVETHWFDSVFGSIFSQAITVPIAAMAIAGLNLGLGWIIGISMLLMGVEEVFLALNIYEHNWWKTWYTGSLLIIGFMLAKLWYKLLENPYKLVKFMTMYMTLIVYANSMRFFMVVFFETHYYNVDWFSNSIRDSIAGNALYLLIWMIPVTLVVMFGFKWYWILLMLGVEWIIDQLLIKNGLLIITSNWSIAGFILILLITLILFRFIYIKWFDTTTR